MRIAFLGMVLLCIFSAAALAAPRKWKDVSGKHTTEADFVELDGASLRLKRTDGKEVVIPLARLAVDDQIYAMREARLRAVTPPELSAKGKELSRQLVKEVKAAADPYSLKTKFDFDDLEGDLAPASRALQKNAEELITLEGRRSAVAPAISELLKDGSAAVRIVAAKGAQEFGDAAVSAAPALVVCLDDPLELVQSLAKQAIDHFGNSTDAAVPALLSAMEKGPLSSRKDVARLLIGAGNRGSGPHLEDAVPRLARLVMDPKQEGQRRVLAAYALHGILEVFRHDRGFDHRLQYAARNQNIQEWVEQQTASRSKLLRKNAASLAAALPAMEDAELISLTFVIVAKDAPEDLRKLPSPVLSALVEKLQDVDFDNDLLHNIDSPLDILQSLIQRRNLNLQLSTEQSLKLLASENDRLRRFGQSQLIRSPEQTRKIMPQIAKLLRESKNSEVRTSALVILQRGAMVSPDDLSSLPVIPVRLKTTSTGATFQIGEAKASGIPQLAAAVTQFKPPKPAETAFDIEQALKEATAADEQQVRYMALQALASRGTESAKKIVQDLSRTALQEETRELAQNVLEQRRDGGFENEEGEKKDDSPFEPGKKKERRSLVAELVLDADLRMEPALQILTAGMDADVQGLRLVLLSKEGKR
ncbi:MAG: hypothetical protein IAF94_02815, partial [Pirellulaceae bacterium]|nr:hypothetical protein [Pirellulaceae bacterium]